MMSNEILLTGAHYSSLTTHYVYGTAGFRMEHSLLDQALYRMGILAALRSANLEGKVIGAMITASHNSCKDNGVKLVDPNGEMLVENWEHYATLLANSNNLGDDINTIITTECILNLSAARVIVARDTRPSGVLLTAAFMDGVKACQASFTDYGVQTTPILHYLVKCLNDPTYAPPTVDAYYLKLASAFHTLAVPKSTIHLDAANGVGTIAAQKLAQALGSDSLEIILYNTNIQDQLVLNHQCGADFVKMNQTQPPEMQLSPNMRCASLDGDADRIVYYYTDKTGKFKLLDGDKIATLAAGYIMTLVKETPELFDVRVGLIQTAYANGSSTEYARKNMGVPVVFTSTGVKHLHHAAQAFDIGVYFEANGHGTVLFAPALLQRLEKLGGKLNALANVINQAVGDALSDMLLVEAVLGARCLTLEQWDNEYADLPSKQIKVKVANRYAFKTTNADTQLLEPIGLQDLIDKEVSNVQRGRCFVRPSGTEDCVRVYCEAASRADCDALGEKELEIDPNHLLEEAAEE